MMNIMILSANNFEASLSLQNDSRNNNISQPNYILLYSNRMLNDNFSSMP